MTAAVPLGPDSSHRRPAGADDATVAAVGKLTEAFERLERARGHLYTFHQLEGRVDRMMAEAAAMLRSSGHDDAADRVEQDIVGRNVLEGRWTFQIVEEFDDLYYRPVQAIEQEIRDRLMAGRRHVYEAEMKAHGRNEQPSEEPPPHEPPTHEPPTQQKGT